MLSSQIPEEFKDIRPYADDELPQVLAELMADEQFMSVAAKVVPDLQKKLAAAVPAMNNSAKKVKNADFIDNFMPPGNVLPRCPNQ